MRSGRFGPPRFRLGHRVSELESRPDRLSNVPEAVGNAFARSADFPLPFDVASPAIQLFFGPYRALPGASRCVAWNPSPELGRGSRGRPPRSCQRRNRRPLEARLRLWCTAENRSSIRTGIEPRAAEMTRRPHAPHNPALGLSQGAKRCSCRRRTLALISRWSDDGGT